MPRRERNGEPRTGNETANLEPGTRRESRTGRARRGLQNQGRGTRTGVLVAQGLATQQSSATLDGRHRNRVFGANLGRICRRAQHLFRAGALGHGTGRRSGRREPCIEQGLLTRLRPAAFLDAFGGLHHEHSRLGRSQHRRIRRNRLGSAQKRRAVERAGSPAHRG